MSEETPKLTRKQQLFIDYYLQSFNASEAARLAGYSEKTAHAMGWENLRKPEIKAAIDARLDEVHMSADEALKLTADIARADMGDFYDDNLILDFKAAREKGLTKLVKKIRQKTTTFIAKSESEQDREVHEIELELYPADAAQDRVIRIHGKYKDLGSPDNPLNITVKRVGVDMDKV